VIVNIHSYSVAWQPFNASSDRYAVPQRYPSSV